MHTSLHSIIPFDHILCIMQYVYYDQYYICILLLHIIIPFDHILCISMYVMYQYMHTFTAYYYIYTFRIYIHAHYIDDY